MTEKLIETDKIKKVNLLTGMIKGCFAESWNPLDDASTLMVEDIARVTFDATEREVTPKHSGTDLLNGTHPFSNVTHNEVWGDLSLTTDANMESVAFDPDLYYTAIRTYDNGGALKKVMPSLQNNYLNAAKGASITFSETRFVPEFCRYGRPGNYMGEMVHMPLYTDKRQVADSFTAPSAGADVNVKYHIEFLEWNQYFDQGPGT